MPTLWRVRSFVCLLLTVSTVIGAVAPAHACACAAPVKFSPAPPAERANPPTAAKSCCQVGATKQSCCRPTTVASAKASCCGDKPSPATSPADLPGCHCLRCDCDAQGVPPAPAAPITAPVASDFDGSDAVSLFPVVLIAEPVTASRVVCLISVGPTNHVISLSRLNC